MADKHCFKGKNYNPSFLASSFLRGMAFNKSISAFDNVPTMSVNNKNDILLAVKKAYIDMSPRTFKGLTKSDSWQKGKETVFDWLAEQFVQYFKNTRDYFDAWHEKLCDEFLSKFGELLKNHKCDPQIYLKYGKAQKIVNMTFKYLFCFDDADPADFQLCHMPIDSYTLKWYKEISQDKSVDCWSKLEKDTYQIIQQTIKKELGNYTPLEAEFYIWAEYNH